MLTTTEFTPKTFESYLVLMEYIRDYHNQEPLYLAVSGYNDPQLVTDWNVFSDGPWAICGKLNGGWGLSYSISTSSDWYTKTNKKT